MRRPQGNLFTFKRPSRGGAQQLYVRALDRDDVRRLAGTEDAQVLAVSLDVQRVAFWAGGAREKMPLAGGLVVEVARGVALPPWGLSRDARGSLYLGRDKNRIWKVSAEGGPGRRTPTSEAVQK